MKPILRKLSTTKRILADELRHGVLAQILPPKPTSLNFLANDICNSRCQMCNIWKRKKDSELSPIELASVLENDLFSDITSIGISGGEPTLRKDLPALIDSICRNKPKICSINIISNGINHDQVKERLLACSAICEQYGVQFSLMFSLDGIEEIHDLVRGRKGNFQSVVNLLEFFHNETSIPTSFGCTVTKDNANHVDDVLDFSIATGIYGRFRIAEFIQRLYNENQLQYIRAFDKDQSYHLGLFFYRLEHFYEKSPVIRNTYRNIREMLTMGKPRSIGCPYHSRAMVLTSRADLLFCSPKSGIIGNALSSNPLTLFRSGIGERKRIIKENCSNCIHDYHYPPTFFDILNGKWRASRIKKLFSLAKLMDTSIPHPIRTARKRRDRVLIVGWYGTETCGDKAILGSILKGLQDRPQAPKKIFLSSLFPFVTIRTLDELCATGVRVVETYSSEFVYAAKICDEVIMGGGPLMDLGSLDHVLFAFTSAKKRGASTLIEGCGIGPTSQPVYKEAIGRILNLADEVKLRDTASREFAVTEFGITNATTTEDPACRYVREFMKSHSGKTLNGTNSSPQLINCFFREPPQGYFKDMTKETYQAKCTCFEQKATDLMVTLINLHQAQIQLLPMHCFSVGGDDREFSRKLLRNIRKNPDYSETASMIHVECSTPSPASILQHISAATLNICMRYHSVVFAHELGAPFVAIDYTRGGKIRGFLKDVGKSHLLIDFEDFLIKDWSLETASLLKLVSDGLK